MASPLSLLNYMNVIAYVANLAVTYGVGVLGIGGRPTNAVLSEKYQTLVTPAGWAFAIWGLIFVSQLIFTIAQLLPAFRGSRLVAKAIGYDYVGVCVAQIFWTLSFTFEIIWLSFASMLSILYFLLTLVNDEYKEVPTDSPVRDYWLLKFPFSLHCGWIIAASFVNLSVLLVDLGVASNIQLYTGYATLAILFLVSLFATSFLTKPEYVIPLVLSWASVGIYYELGSPKDLILNSFSQSQINYVRTGALATAILILVTVIIQFIRKFVKDRRSSAASPRNDESSTNYTRIDDGDNATASRS